MSTTPESDDTNGDDFSERDRALREQLQAEADPRSTDEQIDALRERNRELEAEVQELRSELETATDTIQGLAGRVNDLAARVDGNDDPRANGYYEHLTILEKYHEMSEEERADLLEGSTAKLRALEIFENWTDWAMCGTRDQSEWFISTNQTRGAYGKMALKIDLEQATGEDLQNVEVYRAMRMVAKLSAKDRDDVDVTTDEYGRKHITGGAFEFHEKVNPDDSGDGRFKMLTLVDEEAVTLP